jgi:hypothetical protein
MKQVKVNPKQAAAGAAANKAEERVIIIQYSPVYVFRNNF